MKLILSDHAKEEIARRQIPMELINAVLDHPSQIVDGYNGTTIFQSCVFFPENKLYLLRIVTKIDASSIKVITAYRTSQIGRYWRNL